jgi:Na+/phosphate symporter
MISPSVKRKLKDISFRLSEVNSFLAALATEDLTGNESLSKAVISIQRQIRRIYDIVEDPHRRSSHK